MRGAGAHLHRPEVKGQEEKHSHKTAHEALAEPVTAHVGDDGTHAEKQVEKRGHRVPRKEPRSPLRPGPQGQWLNVLWPKLQYFGHLIRRADSLEKTLRLGKTESRKNRG